MIAEFKEKERRARIQAAVNEIEAEKVIGYVDPEVEKARKNAELDSATQHYIAMGQTVENGEFSQDEYRRVQEAAHDNKPETKKKSWWQTNLGKFTLATTAVLTTMIGLQSLQGNSPPSTEYQYPWWCAHIPNPAKCIDDFRHYEETQWDQWVEEALYKASMPSFVFSPDISQQIVYPDEINGYPIVTRETQKAPDVVLIDSELGDDGPYDAIDNPAGYKIEDNPDAKYHTIVVHHTGSPERIAEMDVLRDYAYSLGSADIDYHFVIFPDGSIYEARDLRARGSHVNAAFDNDGNAIFGNSGTIGIAFVGCLHFQAGGTHNCPEDMLGDPTEDQIQSFDALTGLLTNSLSNLGCMAGHGEFPKQEGTNCPGNRCTPFVHEVAENYDLNHTNPAACYP